MLSSAASCLVYNATGGAPSAVKVCCEKSALSQAGPGHNQLPGFGTKKLNPSWFSQSSSDGHVTHADNGRQGEVL